MGSVFKKTVTRKLPAAGRDRRATETRTVRLQTEPRPSVSGSVARWHDRKGRTRTAPVTTGKDGAERIRDESRTYFARYRDGNNHVVEVPTGCRDKTAAQNVLADLERKAERVRAGLLTPAEARTAEHLTTPIGEHVAAYIGSLEASGASEKYVREARRILDTVLAGCEFRTLADLDRETVERWLNQPTKRECIGEDAQHGSSDPHRLRELVR